MFVLTKYAGQRTKIYPKIFSTMYGLLGLSYGLLRKCYNATDLRPLIETIAVLAMVVAGPYVYSLGGTPQDARFLSHARVRAKPIGPVALFLRLSLYATKPDPLIVWPRGGGESRKERKCTDEAASCRRSRSLPRVRGSTARTNRPLV
jgi:hypothetical protein